MAKLSVSLLLLLALIIILSDVAEASVEGKLHPEDCKGKCKERCSEKFHKKVCMFFCRKCCAKCLCVSLGTSGDKETCPCYKDWIKKLGCPDSECS